MSYQSTYLEYRRIFSTTEIKRLHELSTQYPYENFLSNVRNFEDRAIDYAYVSAKIEWNDYTSRGAVFLLKYGFTEERKTFKDALMLVSLKKAFEAVTRCPATLKTILNKNYLCTRHTEIVEGLLPADQLGTVRQLPMEILGSSYRPLADAKALDRELEKLFAVALTIDDPFDLCVYLHCNLIYLQYFSDGNKRLARLIQTAVLASKGLTPLFLQENDIDDYREAVIAYYEAGDYTAYKQLFLQAYEHSILFLLGKTPKQIEAEKRALQSIRERQNSQFDDCSLIDSTE